MSSSVEESEERARAIQVGLLMKRHRRSFSRGDGRKGITQTELLQRMEQINPDYGSMNHGTVSRWESGETLAATERIETFGEALNLSDQEIDELKLVGGLDPSQQESRTLTCIRCGGETVTAQVKRNQRLIGDGLEVTKAMRMRRCLSCGHSEESCEHWTRDPREAASQRLEQILDYVEGAAVWIKQALREAKTTHEPQDHDEELEVNNCTKSGGKQTFNYP